ncbi:MAG: sigma-54 dependent transcriptional regulator [Bacteriovoracaceae bacterium]|jgi:DNA-binding NtrC family response regulator|nr:sigma-54 dependent transcriptional regulator [Bacteriovoracaceae bacterium]
MKPRILIVDDCLSILESFKGMLSALHHEIDCANSGKEALDFIKNNPFSYAIAFVDHNFTHTDDKLSKGHLICQKIKNISPDTVTVIVSADESKESYKKWLKADVDNILYKPVTTDKLCVHAEIALEKFNLNNGKFYSDNLINKKLNMIGPSMEFQEMGAMALKFANSSENVLLIGETGTGKELLARAIHNNSPRKDFPYIVVDCSQHQGDISLMTSELFGHLKGAFTGADKTKKGAFEEVCGGTIFLDEFHQLGAEAQPRLLRAIQERVIKPLGENRERKVDFRLICGAKPELLEKVDNGDFLPDLYFRVQTLSLKVPPLRERADDILALCSHFQRQISEKTGVSKKILSGVLKRLKNYPWPGNVRELENLIKRLYVVVDESIIREVHLPDKYRAYTKSTDNFNSMTMNELDHFFMNQQKILILKTLKDTSYNISETAKRLNMNRNSLNTKLRSFDLMKLTHDQKEGLLLGLVNRFGFISTI